MQRYALIFLATIRNCGDAYLCAALLVSCGNSSEKMKQLAKENLELSLEYQKQLKIIAVSEPDSAFGPGYFTQDEVKGMRQMRSMADIHSLIAKGDKKREFSGWKVKIDYQCVDAAGLPYRSERWCFIDKEGKQVYKSFEVPIP